MRGAQDVRQEIANTLDMMRSADASEREYLVGRLAGLLWVADGETLRTDARAAAVQAWERVSKTEKFSDLNRSGRAGMGKGANCSSIEVM